MTCIWDFYYKIEDKTKNLTEETDITDMTAQRLVDCTETMEPSRAWMESLSPDAHGYVSMDTPQQVGVEAGLKERER